MEIVNGINTFANWVGLFFVWGSIGMLVGAILLDLLYLIQTWWYKG